MALDGIKLRCEGSQQQESLLLAKASDDLSPIRWTQKVSKTGNLKWIEKDHERKETLNICRRISARSVGTAQKQREKHDPNREGVGDHPRIVGQVAGKLPGSEPRSGGKNLAPSESEAS